MPAADAPADRVPSVLPMRDAATSAPAPAGGEEEPSTRKRSASQKDGAVSAPSPSPSPSPSHTKPDDSADGTDGVARGAMPVPALPPAMAAIKQQSVDEVLQQMNRMPLFMTELDETDGEDGSNEALEAIRALAYEGTRAEIAGNFREYGNEQARLKRWTDAKEFYDKAIAALRASSEMLNSGEGEEEEEEEEEEKIGELVELDPVEEKRKEREIEEACLVNRALCNLELKNYRSCTLDCASTLRLNPRNIKAWYRSASACLALDKIPEAADACDRGLELDAQNVAMRTLSAKIEQRRVHLDHLNRQRREREEKQLAEASTLKRALKSRGIRTRTTDRAPEMEDATVKLESPLDATSTLSIPVLFLYPVHLQSDFIKAFRETENINDHLSYILPLPWDESSHYTLQQVECFMETAAGGLIKAGKKLPLIKLLEGGKVEVVDGLVKVNVVPKEQAAGWIEEFKRRRAT